MTRAWYIAAAIFLMAGAMPDASAQGPVRVQGGDLLLSITNGAPGQQLLPVLNTSTRLRFRRGIAQTKVSVSTVCPGQRFTLSVLATNLNAGVAAPEVQLTDGMLAADFITDVPSRPPNRPMTGQCVLRYTASATYEQGNSTELRDDIHTVTFTIMDQ
jgi:hypothetical protein